MPTTPTIAEQVRARLHTTGLLLSQVSHSTRIPANSLYGFRKGHKTLSADNLQKLVDFFGLELRPKKARSK